MKQPPRTAEIYSQTMGEIKRMSDVLVKKIIADVTMIIHVEDT